MPFPGSPTLLLAAASFALLSGRFFHVRIQWFFQWYFVSVVVVAAYFLAVEPIQADVFPFRQGFRNDSLAVGEQWLALMFGLLTGIALFDSPRRTRDTTNLYGFLLFAMAGLMLIAVSSDFITLGLSLEVMTLAIRGLRRSSHSESEIESKYASTFVVPDRQTDDFWFGCLASGGLWLGIAILSNTMATTHFSSIRHVLTVSYEPGSDQSSIGGPSKLILLAVGLISMSLFARLGLVPFSLDFCPRQHRPSRQVDGFGMLAQQFAGSIALTRLFGCVFVGLGQPLIVLSMAIALATFALTAVLISRGVSSGARSISHFVQGLMLLQSGWLVIGLMIISTELLPLAIPWGEFSSKTGTLVLVVFMQLTGLLACGSVFWVLGSLGQPDSEVAFLEDVKGLGHYAKSAAWTLIVGMATLAGFPLTAGFWVRWTMLLAGNNVHAKSASRIFEPHAGMRLVILAGVIATSIAAIAVIRVGREMFLEAPLRRRKVDTARGALFVSTIAALACLLLGVAPQCALHPLRSISSPRFIAPDAPQRGSGKNLLGSLSN